MSDSSNYSDDDAHHDQTLPVFFLFFMVLLALVLLLSRALQNQTKLNSFLSEPAMVLIVSVVVSALVKILFTVEDMEQTVEYDGYYDYRDDDDNGQDNDDLYHGNVDQDRLSKFLLTFSGEVFFMVFLPPIMFNSGYELKRELFFRHLKPILSFAVVGTALSGIVTGLILWGILKLGWTGEVSLTVWELLTFGSLITATDTVSVLGVLNKKQVNPHLFSLVFGESAFNDAIAIVLFQSFSHVVRRGVKSQQFFVDEATHFVMEFLFDVLGCPLLGVTISWLAALVFKVVDFHGTPVLELSLYLLLMYIPFIFAEVLGMSGIITIFVTGIFARRYIEPNVSGETKHNAEVIFQLVAYLAETCIFLNLGMSVFGFTGSFHWQFIIFAFVASLIGRAMSIYPISFLHNWSLTERMEESSIRSSYHNRRPTVDVALSNETATDISEVLSQLEVAHNKSMTENPHDYEAASFDDSNASNSSDTQIVRRTPAKRLDKVIPSKFMHFLWFAGLRGAVAYACARDFPNVHGNRDEVIAATMVIVFFSVIVMGAVCEPLLHILGIRMGVNNDEYMREWRNRRKLDGKFHRFEQKYIYDIVVRKEIVIDDDVEEPDKDFHLTADDGSTRQHRSQRSNRSTRSQWSHRSSDRTITERAMTASTTARTLTGSAQF